MLMLCGVVVFLWVCRLVFFMVIFLMFCLVGRKLGVLVVYGGDYNYIWFW